MKSRQLLQRKLFLLYERESVSPEIQQTLEQLEKPYQVMIVSDLSICI